LVYPPGNQQVADQGGAVHPPRKKGELTTAFLPLLFACQCTCYQKLPLARVPALPGFFRIIAEFIENLYRFGYSSTGKTGLEKILDFLKPA
jgi:hypothetical protein